MDAVYTHLSDPKRSMIQSAVNEYINRQTSGSKGLNHTHEKILALNDVLQATDTVKNPEPAPPQGILNRVINWIRGLFGNRKAKSPSDLKTCLLILKQYVEAKLAGNLPLEQQKLDELKYSDCDPDWIRSMTNWFEYYVDRMKTPKYVIYQSLGDFSYPLPAVGGRGLNVGLIGDWGTGEAVAESVLEQLFLQKPDVIIHVGDIYYSGTEQEYKDHFIDLVEGLRTKHNLPIPVYNMPGNHDYYSGGHAFHDALAVINAKLNGVPAQEASYFTLSNDAWHIQAMDTGFHDRDALTVAADYTHLRKTETVWHNYHLDRAIAQNKKVILLSHHQLFSRYMAIGGQSHNQKLMDCFGKYIQDGQVAAWFWGHEHLLEIYEPFMGLDKGRCIGNGAVPIFFDNGKPYQTVATHNGQPLANLPESLLPLTAFTNNGQVYDQGFAILTLHDDQTGMARYYAVNDSQHVTPMLVYEEALGANPAMTPTAQTQRFHTL